MAEPGPASDSPSGARVARVPALLRPNGQVDLFQARLWAGVVAALVAWRTRNIAITLVVGMGVLILLDQI